MVLVTGSIWCDLRGPLPYSRLYSSSKSESLQFFSSSSQHCRNHNDDSISEYKLIFLGFRPSDTRICSTFVISETVNNSEKCDDSYANCRNKENLKFFGSMTSMKTNIAQIIT